MADLTINGKTLTSLSAYLYDAPDSRHVAPRKIQPSSLYGRAGAVAGPPSIDARALRYTGRIVTTANTAAARVAAEHTLRDLVGNGGLLNLELNEGTTPVMEIDALLEALTLTPVGHPLLSPVSEWQLDLLAPDTLWRDSNGHLVVSVAATSTRYNLPLGTAPSSPRLTILGAATTPTVTIRDSGGAAQVTLVFATVASTDTLEVDCEAGTITKYASGVASNGIAQLTSGTFPFRLDPAWGDYATSRYPTIETTSGSADVLYAKRYW